MCLEVYHPQFRIAIQYEHEFVAFYGPSVMRSRYILLVRNDDDEPISRLLLLYPRRVFKPISETTGKPFQFVTPPGARLNPDILLKPDRRPFSATLSADESNLAAIIANPNKPYEYVGGLEGTLSASNLSIHRALDPELFDLLNHLNLTALELRFKDPLPPGKSHWIVVDLHCDAKAHPDKSGIIYQDLSSPVRVRRFFSEFLQGAINKSMLEISTQSDPVERDRWNQVFKFYTKIVKELQLEPDQVRKVDLQLHLLKVATRLSFCSIVNWNREGHLYMLGSGPEQISDKDDTISMLQWKSGSMLDVDSTQSRLSQDADFKLRLALSFLPRNSLS